MKWYGWLVVGWVVSGFLVAVIMGMAANLAGPDDAPPLFRRWWLGRRREAETEAHDLHIAR